MTTTMTPATSAAHPATSERAPLPLLIMLLLMRTVLIFAGDGLVYAVERIFGLSRRPWSTAVLAGDVHIVVVADLITLLVLARVMHRRGGRLRDLVGRVRGKDLPVGLLVLAIVAVAFVVASYLGNLVVYHGAPPAGGTTARIPWWFATWTLLVMPATVAVSEELLYRGYLQPQFTARFGRWPALIIVAAGFALQHAGLSALSAEAVSARLIATFLGGVVLGLLRMWLKRLTPLIFAHWLLDVLLLGLPMMMVAGH